MGLHVFVVMPFGVKEGIDFNRVYGEYIKPALEAEGFEVFRADEEVRAGDIRTDMFQELLIADLVVADLSLDNPYVYYLLGVRHGLRARGIVQIYSRRDKNPFDIYTDRKLHYNLKDGAPDPKTLEEDKKNLGRMARETVESKRKISPVYSLLSKLEEPEWKKLIMDEEASEFGEEHQDWESRIEVARQKQLPGDIMVLAEEAPIQPLRLEAQRTAAKALLKLGQYRLALEMAEKALASDQEDLESRQLKGILLGRLERTAEARDWLERLVQDLPNDAENLALLGRMEKNAWLAIWQQAGRTPEEMLAAASDEAGLLEDAYSAYLKGFRQEPSHYYSGINALALRCLLDYLMGGEGDEEIRQDLAGGVRWAVKSATDKETPERKDYWARVTLGDLEVLVGETRSVKEAYKNAVAAVRGDWFSLDSSRQQLLILKDLGFRPEQTAAALDIFEKALKNLRRPEDRWEPEQVFLFSGHMIDAPGRTEPRFPPAGEARAAAAIAARLAEWNAGERDLAMCGGACGGDLLFAEACLNRGLRLELRIPFLEPVFLEKSVSFAGEGWRDRFYQVKNNPRTRLFIMPEELGPLPAGANPYERNNLWLLYSALAWGLEKVRFLCLWDGKGGDGPGGTKHIYDAVKERSGKVWVLETKALFGDLR
jgi:tetratricopeptide (TPR) repeat protein